MGFRKYAVGQYSTLYATDVSYLVRQTITTSASKVIVFCHGANGSGYQAGIYPIEAHVTALRDAGFVVLGVDHARINSYADPDACRAMDDVYTYVTSTLGYSSTKIGLMGWSMGGGTALNWLKRQPSKVACAWLWNPMTDLRYFRDASGSYTPAYGNLNGATQGGRTTEINAVYAATSNAVGAYTIPASGGAGITMTITTNTGKSFADGHNQGVVGKPEATVNAVAFTYTGKTDSTLIGCVSTTGSSISVTNGAAITSSYAKQSNGYRLYDEPASWRSLGIPIKVVQASDDTTVPPGQNLDATNGWVAQVADANVTLRTPTPTGGHVDAIATVPPSEVVAFFTANLT